MWSWKFRPTFCAKRTRDWNREDISGNGRANNSHTCSCCNKSRDPLYSNSKSSEYFFWPRYLRRVKRLDRWKRELRERKFALTTSDNRVGSLTWNTTFCTSDGPHNNSRSLSTLLILLKLAEHRDRTARPCLHYLEHLSFYARAVGSNVKSSDTPFTIRIRKQHARTHNTGEIVCETRVCETRGKFYAPFFCEIVTLRRETVGVFFNFTRDNREEKEAEERTICFVYFID